MKTDSLVPKGEFLPKGDRWDLPAGRGQIGLSSLLWLSTLAAVVLAAGRLLHFGSVEMLLLLALTAAVWWQYAPFRQPPAPQDSGSAEALRKEIRRWKRGGDGG